MPRARSPPQASGSSPDAPVVADNGPPAGFSRSPASAPQGGPAAPGRSSRPLPEPPCCAPPLVLPPQCYPASRSPPSTCSSLPVFRLEGAATAYTSLSFARTTVHAALLRKRRPLSASRCSRSRETSVLL